MYNIDMMSNRIKSLRKKRNISLEKLEEILSASRQTISNWEKGQSVPTAWDLKEICDFYGCDTGYIFGEHEEKWRAATNIRRETGLSEEAINVLRKLHAEKNADNEIISFLNLIIESIEFRSHMSSLSHSSMEYIRGYIKTEAERYNPSDIDKMLNSSSTIKVDIQSGKGVKVLKPKSSFEDDSDLKYDEYNEKAYHLTKTFERLIMFLSKNAGVFKQLKKIREENANDIKKRNKKIKKKLDEFAVSANSATIETPAISDEDS